MEYKELGECLSKRRREAAENGNEHIVARKLGALFSHTLPSTPKLVRAYGKRASEIVQDASEQVNAPLNEKGIFGEWTGPDGTGIWAAATSGTGAIAAHLLACMLARIWKPPEAEAIWDEIIQARKHELSQTDSHDPLWATMDFAARIEITRSQISMWDSNARAWLEVADRSKMRQQKQLLLLVQNAGLGIPINQEPSTYVSVMSAWITALMSIERLLEGVPQSITDGSIILALTSWHLYPNMFRFGAGSDIATQHDDLVPEGAVITLGQWSRPPDADPELFWSLPLAYLKYYGDPVLRTRSLGDSTSRLTFSEFTHVILGSLLANWKVRGDGIERACECLSAMGDYVSNHGSNKVNNSRSWLQTLAMAADSYISASASERPYTQGLTLRGYRRCANFLADFEQGYLPFFGLDNLNTMLRLCPNMETKIGLMRLVSENLSNASHDSIIIRYQVRLEHRAPVHGLSFDAPAWVWEYASALKDKSKRVRKRRKTTKQLALAGHFRWRAIGNANKFPELSDSGEKNVALEEEPIMPGETTFFWVGPWGVRSADFASREPRWDFILGDPSDIAIFKRSDVEIRGSDTLGANMIVETLQHDWFDPEELCDFLEFRGNFFHPRPPQYIHYLKGIAAAAEVYKLMPGATISTDIFSMSMRHAMWLPRTALGGTSTSETAGMASHIHGATVDPRLVFNTEQLFDDSLHTFDEFGGNGSPSIAPTTPDIPSIEPPAEEKLTRTTPLSTYTLSRAQTFSCITLFENPTVNLDPRSLDQVIAISARNSIYVAMPLICDPFETIQPSEVRHITGNIGKPGLTLMIPPIKPKVINANMGEWKLVNHAPFDGRMEDAFQHTSLHLSFTKYQLPVTAVEHGYQAVEANFVETLTSVFDGDRWIADLDVLQALVTPTIRRVSLNMVPCRHKCRRKKPRFLLTSIDSWAEFMDRPPNACLIRASGNWTARLSAVVLNAQQIEEGFKTIVLEDKKSFCWECIEDLMDSETDLERDKVMFVW